MNIYDKHAKAFENVRAAVIVDGNGNRKATVSIKYPKDGAGRLTLFLHIIGTEMVYGTASGYGYDKAGAAFENACGNLSGETHVNDGLCKALYDIRLGGYDWEKAFRDIGLNVLLAV
jgi:hypothetical protein